MREMPAREVERMGERSWNETRAAVIAALLASLCGGCDTAVTAEDAGGDAAQIDAASPLDGGARDAGDRDAGGRDASAMDAGAMDSGAMDGSADAGAMHGGDAGAMDGGSDAGSFDAGSDASAFDDAGADAGPPDAGPGDAGPADAGPPCVVPTDYPSIGAALLDSSCLVISVLAGTYGENLRIVRPVDIVADGAVVVEGDGHDSVVSVGRFAVARLVGLTIRNGVAAYGGGIVNQGTLTLEDVVVTGNEARSPSVVPQGGGIANLTAGTLVMRRTRVENNVATCTPTSSTPAAFGAGIYSSGGSVRLLEGSSVTGNTVTCAGFGQSGQGNGGGVAIAGAALVIDASVVESNFILLDASASATGAQLFGAGISAQGGSITLRNGASVSDNVGTVIMRSDLQGWALGGGIFAYTADLTIDHATVASNRAEAQGTTAGARVRSDGGGLCLQGAAHVDIADSTIDSNEAVATGTGIQIDARGAGVSILAGAADQISIARSTLSGNAARGDLLSVGGGLDATMNGVGTPTLVISESTVSGNRAEGGSARGGGVHIAPPYAAAAIETFIDSSTITANQASEGGGVYYSTPGAPQTHLRNTLLYANDAATGADCATEGTTTIDSDRYDLFGTQADCAIAGAQTGDIVGSDPLLGPLADNGGPTLTHAIDPLGAAHDAADPAGCADHDGVPFTVDQRGFAREVGRCDIGAVETAP